MNKPLPSSRFGEKYKEQHAKIFACEPSEEEFLRWITHAKEKGKRVYIEPEFAERLFALWVAARSSS